MDRHQNILPSPFRMLETKKPVWKADRATGKGSGSRKSSACQDQLREQDDHRAIPVAPSALSTIFLCAQYQHALPVGFPWRWPWEGSLWDLQAEDSSSHFSLKVSADGNAEANADMRSGRQLVFCLAFKIGSRNVGAEIWNWFSDLSRFKGINDPITH